MSDPRLISPARPLNLAEAFLFKNLGEGRSDNTALVVDDPTLGARSSTYREVAAEASRYGHELRARGIGLEDRVLIVLEDSLPWVASFFGALSIGATVMFLNPASTAEEIAFYLSDSRARGAVTTRAVAERFPALSPHLKTLLLVDDPHTIEVIGAHPAEIELAATTDEDFAIWLYSSGSTGAPKAAVHRAQDFIYNTERYPREVLRQDANDVTVSVPKLFFGYATGSNLLFTFYYGGKTILFPDKPRPDRLFELVERHRATILVNVPTMIAQMADLYERIERKPDVSSLRLLTSAGEALPPELYERWKKSTGVEILDGIGSAEMFHVFISARAGAVRKGSLGTIVEGYEARVVRPDGTDAEIGEVGSLWISGGSAAAFYWQRAEASREVLRGSTVATKDQFVRDADGFFWYRGRADDLMKVGGRWLAPQEIEDALTRHPAVLEAGAAPFTRDGLVKPMAFVVLKNDGARSDALATELAKYVAESTEPYKAPRFVVFVAALPRGDRDKLDRKALKVLADQAVLEWPGAH
ncbi:MAG: benzoate-CoA ligase family protein [Deltaproteobacteria bacterium]|nr:benzoate-CoA ligase family protein [Deltaproteobacteria bacterium]